MEKQDRLYLFCVHMEEHVNSVMLPSSGLKTMRLMLVVRHLLV